jgi:iron complex transport system substrate-binding protein
LTAFNTKLEFLRKQYSKQEKVSVFYQVWNAPLMTQNGNTFISRAIETCGGVNIFADLPMTNPQVSIESILVQDPQVIVASGMGQARPEWLDDWRQYKTLQAVQKNQLFHILPELFQRPTSRFLLGTEQLCEAMQLARIGNRKD